MALACEDAAAFLVRNNGTARYAHVKEELAERAEVFALAVGEEMYLRVQAFFLLTC